MDATLTARTDALKRVPLLATLRHADLEGIAERLTVEQHPAGAEVIKQGASGAATYVIVEGACEVRRKTPRGLKRIAVLKAGDFFGELSIIAPAPRSATVVTQEPTTLYVLSSREFTTALRTNSAMAMLLVKELAKRLQTAVDEFSQG